MRYKFWSLLLVALLVSTMLASCGPATAEPTPKPAEATEPPEATKAPAPTEAPLVTKDELIVADALPSVTLDPHKDGHSQGDHQMILAINDTLVGYKDGVPGNEYEGRLATEWSVSEDGLVWTFKLRQGVVWQGGYGSFTADDVVFTYERLKDPERSLNSHLVESVVSVKAVDDHTLQMELEAPIADFVPQILVAYKSGSIISRAAMADIGEENYALNPIGTGPYQLVERVVGEKTVLERNPDFWGEQPDVPRIVFLDIPEESVRANALEAGEIDLGSFRSGVIMDRLINNENVVANLADMTGFWNLAVNDKTIPDLRVREAIARAINKQELAETVLQYRSNPNVVSYMPPGLVGFPTDKTEELYPYDPERAKQLLAEAGFGPGDLTLRFPTRADFQETSQAIAAYLDAIGIKTELELQEHAIYRQTLRSKGEAYDLYTTYPSRATTTELLAFYGGGHGSHVYSDTEEGVPPPRVAELYAAQASEMDLQRREALIREMIAIVEKDIPCVVFGYPKSPATVHHPWLSGPFVNRSQPFYLGLEWIEIDQQVYAEWAKTH